MVAVLVLEYFLAYSKINHFNIISIHNSNMEYQSFQGGAEHQRWEGGGGGGGGGGEHPTGRYATGSHNQQPLTVL
jgi:hypothetical protein